MGTLRANVSLNLKKNKPDQQITREPFPYAFNFFFFICEEEHSDLPSVKDPLIS